MNLQITIQTHGDEVHVTVDELRDGRVLRSTYNDEYYTVQTEPESAPYSVGHSVEAAIKKHNQEYPNDPTP